MPLPLSGISWPPKQLTQITAKHAEWDAWYVGDPAGLHSVYQHSQTRPIDRVSQYRGGVTGAFARMWWGRPNRDLTRIDDDRLHVPIATDLCQASADLLYADAPSFTSEDSKAQDELDLAVERGIVTQFAEGSEIGAALGDVYYRVTWDQAFADRSFITSVHADAAWPEFRWGRLVGVTFWWVLEQTDSKVVRHLERHELAPNGNGVIFHGLYEGTTDNLGRLVPLTEQTATAGIPVDADSKIDTLSPGLAVVHVPNQRPQRRWRKHPVGANLGRSDLDGVEGHMDKLDMVYSSWMRDIRLAKSRIIVPAYMLDSNGPGRGVSFDADQDVFTTLNAPPREDGKSEITHQQFTIRVQEHMQTSEQLVQNILRTAGYSSQTFGEGDDGAAITATEVNSKDRRTNLTRGRKIRTAQPALVELLKKKLAMDAEIFKTGVARDVQVGVEFVDTTQADPKVLAETSNLLFQAQSASAKTRVAMQHPDWDEQAIEDEAAAILAEFGATVPDPTSFRPGVDDQNVD